MPFATLYHLLQDIITFCFMQKYNSSVFISLHWVIRHDEESPSFEKGLKRHIKLSYFPLYAPSDWAHNQSVLAVAWRLNV